MPTLMSQQAVARMARAKRALAGRLRLALDPPYDSQGAAPVAEGKAQTLSGTPAVLGPQGYGLT